MSRSLSFHYLLILKHKPIYLAVTKCKVETPCDISAHAITYIGTRNHLLIYHGFDYFAHRLEKEVHIDFITKYDNF